MSPLSGVKALDISSALAAPLVTQLLGDLGAEVIKVEPPTGDGYRGRLYPTGEAPPNNPRFDCANRNKRSLAIDLRNPAALPVMEDLIRWADVLVINFRPGVADRLGIGSKRALEINPRLIYAQLTGYGDTGPWARRRGADIWAQATGGTVAVQGSPGGPPILGATAFVDHGAPLALAFGISSALFQRERTGKGTVVKTSLLETTLYMQSSSSFTDFLNGEPLVTKGGRGWSSGFPMGAYPCADGEIVTMLVTDEQWETFLTVLGLDELKGRADLATHEQRVGKRHELYPLLDKAFATKTRAEWSKLFADTGVIRADPALRYDEVAAHPQVQALDAIIPAPHGKVGAFMAVAGPVTVGGTRSDIRRGPPDVGEHGREILGELGRSDDAIEALFGDGVVFDPDHPASAGATHRRRERYAQNLGGAVER